MTEQFQHLDASRIVETARQLERRIQERFQGSSLSRVAHELVGVTEQAADQASWLARPLWLVRAAVAVVLFLLCAVLFGAALQLRIDLGGHGFSEVAQAVEAITNDVVFVGITVYFLLGIERRVKRSRAQKALHVLRSLAHVVDMHQLTKDPDSLKRQLDQDTDSSPERTLTAFELTRYLDYCSELLALLSKVAVLYVQHFDDVETLKTAGDVEDLTVGLSRNIWQKIMILDRVTAQA